MRILYTRTSTLGQCSDRQKVNEENYDLLVEDKISGVVPFFQREGGKRILDLTKKGGITHLGVWQIDSSLMSYYTLRKDFRTAIDQKEGFDYEGLPII